MIAPALLPRSAKTRLGSTILRAAFLVLVWALPPTTTAATTAATTELRPIPEAPLDGLEPAVREQLEKARGKLRELPAEAPAAELIPAYGDLGRLYLLYDRPETALACFENVVRLAPATFEARYFLGVIHQDAGRFPEALAALDRAQEARPDDLPTLLRRGEILFQMRRLDEAETVFERAEELRPDTAALHFGLGRIAAARTDWREAVRRFERTLELQPDAGSVYHPLGLAYRRLGDLEAAKAALAEAGTSSPIFDDPLIAGLFELTATSRSLFIEGNRARRRGRLDLAESFYRRALELDPTDASTLYNLGVLLGENGRVEEAERLFARAVEHDPEHRDARFNLAVGLRARGLSARAADHFRVLVSGGRDGVDGSDGSDDLEARVELGATLVAAGRGEEGAQILGEAAAGPITDPRTGLLLARYLAQTGGGERVDGVLQKVAAVAVRPEDVAELRLFQAEAALSRGDPTAAEQFFDAAGRADPDDPRGTVRASLLRCARGRHREAIEILEEAFRRLPEERAVVENLARLLATVPDAALRDGPRALKLARDIFRRFPDPRSTITLAMALAADGDFSAAGARLEELLRLRGDRRLPEAVLRRSRANLERFGTGLVALPPC